MKRHPDEPDNKAARRLADLLTARGIDPDDVPVPPAEPPGCEPDATDQTDTSLKPDTDHERTI